MLNLTFISEKDNSTLLEVDSVMNIKLNKVYDTKKNILNFVFDGKSAEVSYSSSDEKWGDFNSQNFNPYLQDGFGKFLQQNVYSVFGDAGWAVDPSIGANLEIRFIENRGLLFIIKNHKLEMNLKELKNLSNLRFIA